MSSKLPHVSIFLVLLLVGPVIPAALAEIAVPPPATFSVSVNTSSLAGIHGELHLQFINEAVFSETYGVITEFRLGAPGSLSGMPVTTGAVYGTLPGDIDLGGGVHESTYVHPMTFGSYMSFRVSLSLVPNQAGEGDAHICIGLNADGHPRDLGLIGFGQGHYYAESLDSSTAIRAVPEPGTALLWLICAGVLLAARFVDRRCRLTY
jgi:hypothetical protein